MGKSNIEVYNDSLTSAERSENAQKAGVASGVKRREGRLLRDSLLKGLTEEVTDQISYMLIQKALQGDLNAIRLLRDSIGELPSLTVNADITETVEIPAFCSTLEQVKAWDTVSMWLPDNYNINMIFLGDVNELKGHDFNSLEVPADIEEQLDNET